MLFCSLKFLTFFALVFFAYWALPWRRARVWLLLVASFYFYASWNKGLAVLIAVSALVDYAVALGMDGTGSARLRKLLLAVSLVGNLGVLVTFKYANFFLASLEEVLRLAGASASLPVLSVLVPVGISFYTFEAINYTVDVYRRRLPAERDLGNFLLFILFFPHLVAGPIVRARDFLPQIRRRKRWSWPRAQLGMQYLLMGVFKKLAVADRMALFADPVFASPEQFGSGAVWLAMLAYALQIYCDFSGYSDMALGLAHLLGYKLVQNFNLPYLSANMAEFWKRWHISLSTWLRDYLFFPLGGSRGPAWRTAVNLLVVMTLAGLWHGASWIYVLWGFGQGLLLVIHRTFRQFCGGRPGLDRALRTRAGTVLRVSITFLTISLGLVFFRSTTFATAGEMFYRLAVPSSGLGPPLHAAGVWYTAALVALCHALAARGIWRPLALRLPAPVLGCGYAAVLLLALVLAPGTEKAFIYFQF
jgi:alginate O-acetyltransferase complex protein AlgI